MGILRELFAGSAQPVLDLAVTPGPTFAVDENSIDPAVFGLTSYASTTAPAPRIDRRSAMQVPAVKRARDLIAGTLATLPLELFGPDKRKAPWPLFEQPERNVPRSVTMANTFEDMLFEKVAWWRVTGRAWNNWPTEVERIKPGRVTVDEDNRKVYVDGKHVEDADLIRFHGPTDALLVAGARAIRTCLQLDAAAANLSDGVPPMTYFTPTENADPFEDDEEAAKFLSDYQAARRARSEAYVPAAVQLNTLGWNPEQLQLADARQHAVLEIARLTGIDGEDLSVSTTSRTYFNAFDRRKERIDFTLAPFMVAAQDTLSMRNVTPRGYVAQLNPDSLLRADPAARWASYKVGLEVGAITPERIAEIEGVPLENVRALLPAAAPSEPQETERAS